MLECLTDAMFLTIPEEVANGCRARTSPVWEAQAGLIQA